MGILDGLFGKDKSEEIQDDDKLEVKGESVKVVEVGSSGTEIYAGNLQEEYLSDLQGTRAADMFDRMRRSDPKVKMTVSAMKNPINSASWEIAGTEEEESEQGEKQRKLIEHILFNDSGKTWDRFIREALSMIEFGYSLFEVTYKAEINHPNFGAYNGIKSLAFRSQRTIEAWHIKRSGELDRVEQQANGDEQKNVDIAAEFLLHFAIEMEGDNFEGISILRPAYGPWLRKNEFLKLLAAGVEKYAIPIPTLSVPAGKEQSQEYKKAKQALQSYVSHRCNYLMIPAGWDLDLTTNTFDAEKIRKVINDENVEIVNAALANFLELGQSGSGSYALGTDLSDFFLGGLEYIADQITDVINNVLIPKLVKLNFPDGIVRCELRHSGIRDKAGEELSKIVTELTNAGVIIADDRLEESMRKRFKLPEREESSSRTQEQEGGIVPPPTSPDTVPVVVDPGQAEEPEDDEDVKKLALNGAQVTAIVAVVKSFKEGVIDKSSATELITTAFPIPRNVVEKIVGEEISKEDLAAISETQLSEDKPGKDKEGVEEPPKTKIDTPKEEPIVSKMIGKEAVNLGTLYESNLDEIQTEMIGVVTKHFKTASPEKKFQVSIEELLKVPSIGKYKAQVKEQLSKAYNDSIKQAKIENPDEAQNQMSENEYSVTLSENEKLPDIAKARIDSDLANVVDTQVQDLAKAASLQYGMSVESTEDPEVLASKIKESTDKTKKTAATTGANIQAAKTVNDARRDFFNSFTNEVESFTWINQDPVSDICKSLNGLTLKADDPDVATYWPPLHHNCKTFTVANTAKTKDNPKPDENYQPSKTALKSMSIK